MNFTLDIGPAVIRSYKRLSYQAWYALAEFLDNSTQSYFDNRAALDASPSGSFSGLEIDITFDKSTKILRIYDTAMGMDESDLHKALRVGHPPTNITGRSEFGLGLKTAACWFGDYWTVTTKKLGCDKEFKVAFDVERVASGDNQLPFATTDKPPHLHYTIIEIAKLHKNLHANSKKRLEAHMVSMYRRDISSGRIRITFDNKQPLEYTDQIHLLTNVEGTPYRKVIPPGTTINGRSVKGWVGILRGYKSGETQSSGIYAGRKNAGFAILRRGRVIKGQPDAWRPEAIFGINRNNLLNQRLVGEIELDDFDVSHTKDEILWRDNEEEELEQFLKDHFADLAKEADKVRGKSGDAGDDTGPSQADIATAVDSVKTLFDSPSFTDTLNIIEVPTPEMITDIESPIIAGVTTKTPNISFKIGSHECRVYLSGDESPNDPYFARQTCFGNDVIVCINTRHKHFKRMTTPESIQQYFLECVYDALAEWQCSREQAPITSDRIHILKDRFLNLDTNTEYSPENNNDVQPSALTPEALDSKPNQDAQQ